MDLNTEDLFAVLYLNTYLVFGIHVGRAVGIGNILGSTEF